MSAEAASTAARGVTSMREGWKCPRCERINAPWLSHCDCRAGKLSMPILIPWRPSIWEPLPLDVTPTLGLFW